MKLIYRTRKETPRTVCAFRIDPDLILKIEKQAKLHNLSKSEYIERALAQQIKVKLDKWW